jgi:FkbM family methyltransferase
MRATSWFKSAQYRKSYAQSGEDSIAEFILCYCLGILRPTYLDIGAHHPTWLSNTYLFYEKGCRGVCVEPDPELFKLIHNKRKQDVCLNVGVGDGSVMEGELHILSTRTLSTFSVREANSYTKNGSIRTEKIVKISFLPVNEIVRKYFNSHPNFVSIDTEGMDLQILQSFDFELYRPEVFCIETLTYTEDKTEKKITEIISYMEQSGYFVYADTYINTLFVDKKAWAQRQATA